VIYLRELLDASSQRIIGILEVLSVQKGWITLTELADHVEASERTVSADLSVLRRRWGQKLRIEISTKNGIRMGNQSTGILGSVLLDLFNDSMALNWLKEILLHADKGTKYYEEKLFTSRSTLNRLLPKINKVFAGQGMSIQCRNDKYRIVGDNELFLRQFFTGFMLEMYGLNLQKYDVDVDLGVLMRIIQSVEKQNRKFWSYAMMPGNDITDTYLMAFFVVSLVREEQGFVMASNGSEETRIAPEDLAYLKIRFPHVTKESLCPINQFIYMIYNGWESDAEEKLVAREAEAFFERLFARTHMNPSDGTREQLCFILSSLYLTQKIRLKSTSLLFDRIYYFSRSFQRSNSFLYRIIEEDLQLFCKNVQFDVMPRLQDILFWMCRAYPELSQYTQPKTALIISDFGTAHAAFLASVITSFFNRGDIEVLHVTATTSADAFASGGLNRYDMVITTVPDLPEAHQNVILVDDYPTSENLLKIFAVLYCS